VCILGVTSCRPFHRRQSDNKRCCADEYRKHHSLSRIVRHLYQEVFTAQLLGCQHIDGSDDMRRPLPLTHRRQCDCQCYHNVIHRKRQHNKTKSKVMPSLQHHRLCNVLLTCFWVEKSRQRFRARHKALIDILLN